jgi:hypothetical protein
MAKTLFIETEDFRWAAAIAGSVVNLYKLDPALTKFIGLRFNSHKPEILKFNSFFPNPGNVEKLILPITEEDFLNNEKESKDFLIEKLKNTQGILLDPPQSILSVDRHANHLVWKATNIEPDGVPWVYSTRHNPDFSEIDGCYTGDLQEMLRHFLIGLGKENPVLLNLDDLSLELSIEAVRGPNVQAVVTSPGHFSHYVLITNYYDYNDLYKHTVALCPVPEQNIISRFNLVYPGIIYVDSKIDSQQLVTFGRNWGIRKQHKFDAHSYILEQTRSKSSVLG